MTKQSLRFPRNGFKIRGTKRVRFEERPDVHADAYEHEIELFKGHNMNLSDIILASACRMHNVSVDVRTIFGTVCIKDDSGVHEDIFMQGDDASSFISLAEQAWRECGNVTMSDCYLWQAEQYVECLWS